MSIYLPFVPGTPEHCVAGTRAIVMALSEIAKQHDMDDGDMLMALSSVNAMAVGNVARDADAAGAAFSTVTMVTLKLIGEVLSERGTDRDDTPAHRKDEPEIAALKAMRPAGHA